MDKYQRVELMICDIDHTWDTVTIITPIDVGDIQLTEDKDIIKRATDLWYDDYWKASKGSQKEVAAVHLYCLNSDYLCDKDGEDLPENKTCTILFHNISYYFRDTELDINDSGMEHIAYMISTDFSSGELNECLDSNDTEEEYSGWWSIDN